MDQDQDPNLSSKHWKDRGCQTGTAGMAGAALVGLMIWIVGTVGVGLGFAWFLAWIGLF